MHIKPILNRAATWTFSTLLVLTFLAAALPKLVLAAAPAASCEETYTVRGRESLYRIARDHSVSVYRLARANNLEFPYPITAGQELCIPEEVVFASTNAKWSAVFSNNKVLITGSSFKKQYSFIVRVRENDTTAFYKLGKFKSDREGDVLASFAVPRDLQKMPAINVCLKDAVTDGLVCKRAYRQ